MKIFGSKSTFTKSLGFLVIHIHKAEKYFPVNVIRQNIYFCVISHKQMSAYLLLSTKPINIHPQLYSTKSNNKNTYMLTTVLSQL